MGNAAVGAWRSSASCRRPVFIDKLEDNKMKAYMVSANHLADGKWTSLSPRAVLGGLEDAELAVVKAKNRLIKA